MKITSISQLFLPTKINHDLPLAFILFSFCPLPHPVRMPAKRARGEAGDVAAAPPAPRLPGVSLEPTCSVLVTGLARPFSVPNFKALITEASPAAPVGEVFIDDLRTHALVTLPTVDAAEALRGALQGRTWPASGARALGASFSALTAEAHAGALAQERADAAAAAVAAAAAAPGRAGGSVLGDTEAEEEEAGRGEAGEGEGREGEARGVEGQVQQLLADAQDPDKLSRHYIGWQAW